MGIELALQAVQFALCLRIGREHAVIGDDQDVLDRAIALRHPGDKRVAGHGALKAAGIVRVAGFIGFHVLVVRLLDALLARLCNFGVHLLAQLAAQSFARS